MSSNVNQTGRMPERPDMPRTPPPYTNDVEGWEMWWGFNRHPYLDLKRRVLDDGPLSGNGDFYLGRGTRRSLRDGGVSEDDLRETAGPALQIAIESDPDDTVRAAALVALAKLHPHFVPRGAESMPEYVARYLDHTHREVAESALVALGLVGDPDCAIFLCEIAADDPLGRELTGKENIPRRQRALAALALGLVGAHSPCLDVRSYIVHHLARILESDESASPDLAVACVTSIGLTPLADGLREADALAPPSSSREAQIRFLCEILDDAGEREIVRAHVPRALGNLVQGVDDPQKDIAARVMLDILGNRRRVDRLVRHGLVFGLGMIGDADGDAIDVEIREALRESVRDGNAFQQQISMVSVALVAGRPGRGAERPFEGSAESLAHLLRHAARGKSRVRPWAFLALGLQGHHEEDAGKTPSADAAIALRRQLAGTRAPSHVGAIGLALGLMGDRSAVPLLRKKMAELNDDTARGSVAIALGLLEAREALPMLHATLAEARHRPALLQDVSIALALLGDRRVMNILLEIMRTNDTCYVLSAAVNALGYVGDARAVGPLIEMLGNRDHSVRSRRTAAVALGVVSERSLQPWTDLYSTHLNYVAMTETLVSEGGVGILNRR